MTTNAISPAKNFMPTPAKDLACEPKPWHASFASTARIAIRRGLGVRVSALLAVCLSGFCLPAADVPPSATTTNRYEFRQVHSDDGIGKFYLGREIAQVMGHQAADWLERPERDAEEQPQKLVELLNLKPGCVVADIGAGTGYLSRRLARTVGPSGQVWAVDVQPEMLVLLTNKMAGLGLTNVVPVLGTVTDPKLPTGAVDVVLMVDVYHEFDYPYEMMAAICRSVKPGGRVIFVEFRGEDPQVRIKALHKMTEAQVKKEMAGQPLVWVETLGALPRQHVIVFRRQ